MYDQREVHMAQTPKMKASKRSLDSKTLPTQQFLKLGGGKVGYIKIMLSDEVMKRYPSVKKIPRGVKMFGLYGADGTPLSMSESQHAAIGQAHQNKLRIQSLH